MAHPSHVNKVQTYLTRFPHSLWQMHYRLVTQQSPRLVDVIVPHHARELDSGSRETWYLSNQLTPPFRKSPKHHRTLLRRPNMPWCNMPVARPVGPREIPERYRLSIRDEYARSIHAGQHVSIGW